LPLGSHAIVSIVAPPPSGNSCVFMNQCELGGGAGAWIPITIIYVAMHNASASCRGRCRCLATTLRMHTTLPCSTCLHLYSRL
jgi:hypothetical protein